MENFNKYDYWIDIAEYDLQTAEAMLETKRFLYVDFMCHQVVEKVLKAYYTKIKNEIPPYIHNLVELANRTEFYNPLSDAQKDFIDFLQPFNIQSRYPAYKEKLIKLLNFEKCSNMIQQTKVFFEWIQKQ